MRKIYTLIAGILLAGTASAQLVNGNFESPITQNANFPNVGSTAGWGTGFFSAQTAMPGEGSQSVKLTSVLDPLLAAALNAGGGTQSDTVSGLIFQEINGPVATPAAVSVSLKFKYAPVQSDTGCFVVEVYDTLAAGLNDDVLLYQGVTIFTGNVSTWTNRTIPVIAATGTGTPNQIYLLSSSSIGSIFNGFIEPRVGSELQLDAITLSTGSSANVEENNIANSVIYPNPTSDVLNFNIKGTEATSINIYSLDGKLLLSQDANGAAGSVNVSSLNAGMYIYQIATTSGESVKSTFVKK